jgi:hypothetical protein
MRISLETGFLMPFKHMSMVEGRTTLADMTLFVEFDALFTLDRKTILGGLLVPSNVSLPA